MDVWARRFAIFYQSRKPWKVRRMKWEAYIKTEKNLKPNQHVPSEFFRIGEDPPFAHKRRPWKLQNTYQVIRRLEHS